MARTIFFGDVDSYLADLAVSHDKNAYWLHAGNCESFLAEKKSNFTVYTSLGDLPKDLSKVYNLLELADCVVYSPPPSSWSDGREFDIMDPGSSMQGLSEILLRLLPRSTQILGLDQTVLPDPKPLVDQRKTDYPQLWIAGCSISHGIGVSDDERYGALLAKDLDLSCSFLTRPGSALDWAADQILRSDIRKNDIVVWGLTEWRRLTYIHQHRLLEGVMVSCYDYYREYQNIVSIDNLFSQQTFYNHMYSIQQVNNYCEKIGAKLLLVGLLSNHSLLPFLYSKKNYVQIPYQIQYQDNMLLEKFIDVGSDLRHPGIKQHLAYKNVILDFISQTY